MKNKRRFWLLVSAALSLTILAMVLVMDGQKHTREYNDYRVWSVAFETHNWELNREGAEAFAEAHCRFFREGKKPGFLIRNADHLKATSAVLKAYCPGSLPNYLKSIDARYGGEYSDTTALIRKTVARQ